MNSVFSQTFKDFEYLVIDGGSTDGSAEWIREKELQLTYWVSEKDNGIFHAQNKGCRKAVGEYLLVLNSGDMLAESKTLEKVIPHLGMEEMVYGDLIINEDGKQEHVSMPDELDAYYFMVSSLAHPCVYVKRGLYEKLNGYREDMKITADYEFFLRAVLIQGATYKRLSFPVAVFDAGGISSDKTVEEKHRQERQLSWSLNFVPSVIKTFEEHTRLLRSGELKAGRLVKKILHPFRR